MKMYNECYSTKSFKYSENVTADKFNIEFYSRNLRPIAKFQTQYKNFRPVWEPWLIHIPICPDYIYAK